MFWIVLKYLSVLWNLSCLSSTKNAPKCSCHVFGGVSFADGGPQQSLFSAALLPLFVGRNGLVLVFVHRPRCLFPPRGSTADAAGPGPGPAGRDATRGRLVGVSAHAAAAQRASGGLRRGRGWPLSGSIAVHLSPITRAEWTYLLVFYFPLIISSGMGGKWKQLFIWEIYVLHLAVWFPQLYQCHLGTGIAFYIFRLQQSSFSICCEASNNACLAVFL